ncbi:MAG TPA: hypothetical protein DEF45_06990 [Rhodopirellula sp.]|nr:hypothetical protein [Rhodopirellula sp.]
MRAKDVVIVAEHECRQSLAAAPPPARNSILTAFTVFKPKMLQNFDDFNSLGQVTSSNTIGVCPLQFGRLKILLA